MKSGVCSKCWSKRPGVQTRMLARVTEDCSWRNSFFPPVIKPAEREWLDPTIRRTSKIWTAVAKKSEQRSEECES